MVENKMASDGTGCEVVTIDERAMAAHAARKIPKITSVNVSKSTKIHTDPKIIPVKQTIENKEMVKDLPLPKYIWSVMKNTSKAERLSCITALCTLVICMSFIVHYTAFNKKTTTTLVDIAPHEWRISREMWLAREYISNYTTEEFNPLKLVVVQHTGEISTECHRFIHCAAVVRSIQDEYLDDKGRDIPYNFLIGTDGRVYEGRGWNHEGAHTSGYNKCSVGIGFIGDYREELAVYTKVTDAQLNRTKMLLEEGVREGHLVTDYFIVGAKDVRPTLSPGSNLYNALQQMENYDHENQFADKNCSVIYGHM